MFGSVLTARLQAIIFFHQAHPQSKEQSVGQAINMKYAGEPITSDDGLSDCLLVFEKSVGFREENEKAGQSVRWKAGKCVCVCV